MKTNNIKIQIAALLLFCLASCENKNEYDASGTFEAEETIISAEATGSLKFFKIEEGESLKVGQVIGYIDTAQLFLKKKQFETQIQSVLAQKPDMPAQLAALKSQLSTAEREKQRVAKLVIADAATQKQLDDANSQIDLLKKQIRAQQSSLNTSIKSLNEQTEPLRVQVEQINDQLAKSTIINPVSGTVLTKYTEVNEVVSAGKPLYKIADLSYLLLRAYITGDQLPVIKLGQKVTVLTDMAGGESRRHTGVITWISNKAEFTPKTIQTKDERANLVYAIKVRVRNDGYLKIGMYADVLFNPQK